MTKGVKLQIDSPQIVDISKDLANGVALIRLIEALQGRKYYGKIYEDDPTEIQMLLNVQMALDALREDGVKTVNIGSHDVVEGNTKLILGLIWCLIQRYQIASRSKIPPKKLVMAWIQSVLPELKLTNFRTNWNDGKALSALLEYCQPGLCPEWKGLDSEQGLANCERALKLATQYLAIPPIISAAHLNSPHLDELSCITYLSYFIMRGSCGYRATLYRVQQLLPESVVEDFEMSWSDGYLLSLLVEAVGGPAIDVEQMRFDTFEDCVENINIALEAAADIGVGSLVGAEDIADPQGEHLGVMALAAALCSIGPPPNFPTTQCFTNQQVNLDLAFADGGEVRVDELGVRVIGPAGRPVSADSVKLRKSRTSSGAVLSIIPRESGYHQVRIYCQGVELPSSPISLHVLSPEESRAASRAISNSSRDDVAAESREDVVLTSSDSNDVLQKSDSGSDVDISHKSFAQRRLHIIKQLETQNGLAKKESPSRAQSREQLPKTGKNTEKAVHLEASTHKEMSLRPPDIGLVSFSGLTEPCSVGSIVEVVINAHGDCAAGSVQVDAVSPSGRAQQCVVTKRANSYTASFTPQQVGLWKIGILYEGEHIRGSPFSCQVFDAGLVQVYGLDVGLVGQELRFNVNASEAGRGNLEVSVLRHGRHIPSTVEEESTPQVYRVNFVPDGAGQYKIHVLFNRMEVKGSPFILDIADASAVSVFGEQLRGASVGRPASFMIHAAAAGPNDITVEITAPSGKRRHGVVTALDDVSYKVEWIPQEAGEHSVDVRIFDQSVQDSPFACNVGAPEKVAVRAVPRRILTKDLHTEHSFEIDASSAGSGNLEIMINGGRVPCRVREIVNRQYKAVFTPTQSITHTIEMRFNGEEVAGSPWHIPVEDRPERRHETNRTTSYYSELSGAGLVRAPVNKVASFEITGEGLETNDIQAKIYGPDGREFPVRILSRGNGRYTAEYRIEQVGEHHLTVWIAGRKVDGSPLSVAGYSADRVRLEPLGGGAVGHPVQFVVDAVDAGKGQLEISVNQGRVPNNVQMQGAGRCLVTFIPQHPGTYVIDVTFNGEQVHGCPIKVEILPKQVGEVVHANLTPTAVSTAISAGGSSIAGAFRQSRAPTSPGLLHHTRQRSAEAINPRSPTLLREARGRAEKPWTQSYAPTSTRLSSSLSPNREWAASSTYDRIYTAERTLSPSDPSRSRQFTETTVTHRSPSPPKTTYEQTNYHGRTPSPSGVRSREFAERQVRTPSPSRYERKYQSPFAGGVRQQEKAYRSPSPISRDDIRSRTSDRVVSPFRNTPSPAAGERIRRVEQIDPVAAEEERERRRAQAEREKFSPASVGYTVAQYGQPGSVTIDRTHSPDRYAVPRSYNGTLEKKEPIRDTVSTSTYESRQRAESPEYSAVYERFDRKRDEPPPAPAHAPHPEPSKAKPADSAQDRYRARSPPPDYDTGPSVTQSIATSIKTYDEPSYSETTAVTRTSYTISPKKLDKDVEKKPEVIPHRGGSPVDEKTKKGAKDDLSFLRTQSEFIDRSGTVPSSLPRTEEKTQIYEPTPEKLKRTSELTPLPLADEAQRTMEYLRVRAEDDKILQQHGYGKRSHEPSIEIQEPASDIRDDVIEVAGSKDDLSSGEKAVDAASPRVQALEPVAELPHSPAPSTKSTPHTTPKASMKFKKDAKETKPFEFGKSKFTSKHEVVKRGKDVEVKLENLKLSKEDTLRVVVLPPMRNQVVASGATQPELDTKVKKSGSKYEISFKPTEVGTHKVFAYVNEIQHPLSPFPIRVYDSSEIIVGEIPGRSNLNDTVEFTVDAGRAGFGNLEMAIKDADGVIIPSHVAQLESGTAKFLVTFTPTSKGQHTVNITFNKEVLKNSPFEVLITDPPPPLTDTIDGAASPSLSKKDLKKEKEDKKREEKERAKREKEEKAATLKKDKKSKHKSISKTAVTKIPSLSRVGQPSSVIVEVAGHDQLEITITDNKKNQIGTEIIEIEPGVMQVNFTPQVVGDHDIEVKYGGVPVTAIPFTCRAYDPTKIKVGQIPKGLLDKPVYFTVDASEAGVGNLEVAVNDGRVPSMAHALGQHRYDISFVPKENADHTITIRFNNEPVPGSPFTCQLVSAAQASASGPGLERVPVDELTEIKIQTNVASDAQPEVRVRDPQGNDLPVEITRSRQDDTLCIATYTPKCVGNHQVDISMLGEPIAGSPFTAKAYDARMARLSQCDQAIVGKPCTFAIDAARAGAGNMEIIVSVDNRNVPNFVQAEGQARFKVSFTPQEAKEHVISVRFNGVSVPGSPMRCMVENAPTTSAVAAPLATMAPSVSTGLTGSAPERVEKSSLTNDLKHAQVGQKRGFTIANPGGRAAECNVVVIDPNGGPLPVRCYRQQDDSYWVEFTPEQTGTHTVEVTFGDVPVAGSPFKCEVVDPKKVRVKGLSDALLLRHATVINVDRRQAGAGDLTVEVNDPTGAPLKVEMLKSPGGEDRATFLPNQTGPHKVNVKVAGFQIPGYPQTILVSEQQQPSVYGAAIDHSIKIDEPASLIFDPKGNNGGLKVNVVGPRENKVRHKVMRRPNGTSEVVFSPEEVGAHIVHIDFNNKPIAGSPFTVRVVDPSKVVVNDLDMDRDGSFLLRLGQQNVFDVDATAAGPGKLRAEVRNSESALLGEGPAVDDLGYGKYRVAFTPKQPGRYSIYLYWNELPVESAFPVRARSSEERATTSREAIAPVTHARDKSSSSIDDDVSRVMVRGDGLHRAQLKEPNEFIVDGSDASREGRLTATLFGTKADVPVRVQQLGHNVYKATYTPLTGGNYELHILWNGSHVKGSPFKVSADTASSPAELISVDSSSLKIGIINDDIKTVIDTRRAGPGQLSAQCMGPVKLAYCELYDHRDGTYTLSVRPTEVGKHTLVIKYNDQHVRGSPFLIHVSLPPDPSKVRVYGPGIEHGILNMFKSNFVVETRGAGAGQLTVRVRGPKGAFNVEMQREKKNERTIHCKYEPKEPGDYQVEVKWHGEHVPGSPFLVMIVDTEQELSRFLRGEAPSPTPATPFVPPGWVGPPPMFPPPMGQRFGPPLPMGPPMGPPPPGAMIPFNGPPPPRHKAKYH